MRSAASRTSVGRLGGKALTNSTHHAVRTNVLEVFKKIFEFLPLVRQKGLQCRRRWLIMQRNKPSGLGNLVVRLEVHWFGELPQLLLASKAPAS